jgi:hypothetical protein
MIACPSVGRASHHGQRRQTGRPQQRGPGHRPIHILAVDHDRDLDRQPDRRSVGTLSSTPPHKQVRQQQFLDLQVAEPFLDGVQDVIGIQDFHAAEPAAKVRRRFLVVQQFQHAAVETRDLDLQLVHALLQTGQSLLEVPLGFDQLLEEFLQTGQALLKVPLGFGQFFHPLLGAPLGFGQFFHPLLGAPLGFGQFFHPLLSAPLGFGQFFHPLLGAPLGFGQFFHPLLGAPLGFGQFFHPLLSAPLGFGQFFHPLLGAPLGFGQFFHPLLGAPLGFGQFFHPLLGAPLGFGQFFHPLLGAPLGFGQFFHPLLGAPLGFGQFTDQTRQRLEVLGHQSLPQFETPLWVLIQQLDQVIKIADAKRHVQ